MCTARKNKKKLFIVVDYEERKRKTRTQERKTGRVAL
jgi:hypothetical protein